MTPTDALIGNTRSTTCPNGHTTGLLSWARITPNTCPAAFCGLALDWSRTRGLHRAQEGASAMTTTQANMTTDEASIEHTLQMLEHAFPGSERVSKPAITARRDDARTVVGELTFAEASDLGLISWADDDTLVQA